MRPLLAGLLAAFVACGGGLNARAEDQEVSSYVNQIDRGKPDEKATAIRMLGEIGPAASESVPALIKVLASKELELRYEAIVALGQINSESKQTVPALVRILSEPTPSLRHAAIDALRKFGHDANTAIPQLKKLMSDKEPLISVGAARAIAEIETPQGPDSAEAITALIAGLKNPHQEVSVEAVQGLAAIGGQAVPAIERLIGGSSTQSSLNACDALGAIGPPAASAVNQLIATAKSSDVSSRQHATRALGEIGPEAKSAVPTLIAALDDSDTYVRFNAGASLLRIGKVAVPSLVESLKIEKSQKHILPIIIELGPAAAEATAAVTGLLNSKDGETQREAILAVGAIGDGARSATPQLIKFLEDKQFSFRPAAAFALGKLAAKDAVAALKNASNDKDNHLLRLASVWALIQIDPTNEEYRKIALPELVSALQNDNPEIRREAALALGRMGSRADSAVPALTLLLKDKNPRVRMESLVALAEIGPGSKEAISEIESILAGHDLTMRPTACYALGRIGADCKHAIPHLKHLLASRDPLQKTVAAWAIVQIAPEPETIKVAIPLLADALHGARNPSVRLEAAETLGKIGSGSAIATDALKFALKDQDSAVRKAAEVALAQLK